MTSCTNIWGNILSIRKFSGLDPRTIFQTLLSGYFSCRLQWKILLDPEVTEGTFQTKAFASVIKVHPIVKYCNFITETTACSLKTVTKKIKKNPKKTISL